MSIESHPRNAHTSVGNILGSLIAGFFVEKDWALSFVVPGAIIGAGKGHCT